MTDAAPSRDSGSPAGRPSREGIEIPGDHEDRPWELRAQRIGWAVFAAIILAALAGLMGQGPLSRTEARDPASPVRAEYDRFGRYKASSDLRVHIGPAAVKDGELRLWIGREFLDNVELEEVRPAPARTELGTDRHTLVIEAPNLMGESAVTLRYRPDVRFSRLVVRLGIDGQSGIAFRQFVYP